MNLSIENGALVAIVGGESGSGKSTIASLILKNYKADNGNIKINNLDYKKFPLKTYVKKFHLFPLIVIYLMEQF